MPPATAAAPATQAPPSGAVYSHQQILRVITGIMLCILLAALDQTVVIPAVPAIAAQLNAFGHLSWIVSAYLLTATAATPIYGKLSDMYGRRALLLPALAIFIVASVLCALAQSLPQLIVFRGLQGLGGAGLMAMAQAAIADVVSPRERGRYQGYMAGMWGLASVAGPVVGGWFTDHLSWTFVFWINVPLGLAAMWLCNRALKLLTPRNMRGRIDYVGAALLTAAVTCFLLVLSWGGTEYPWLSTPILVLACATVALASLLIWYEMRTAEAILPPRMFRNDVFTRGVILAFLTATGLLGTTFLLPLFFQLVRGVDASASGFLILPFLAFNVVGAFTGGQISRRLGRTKVTIIAGLAGTCVGFAGLCFVGADSPMALVMVAMAVTGLGLGVCMPNTLVMVQNAANRNDVGTATGALLFLRSMGGAFGSTLVGAVLTATYAMRLSLAGYPAAAADLGAMKPGGALATFGAGAQAAGVAALSSGFRYAFGACLVLLAVALLVALGLRDIPLRTVAAGSPSEAPSLGH